MTYTEMMQEKRKKLMEKRQQAGQLTSKMNVFASLEQKSISSSSEQPRAAEKPSTNNDTQQLRLDVKKTVVVPDSVQKHCVVTPISIRTKAPTLNATPPTLNRLVDI